jgi:hypothetical protein
MKTSLMITVALVILLLLASACGEENSPSSLPGSTSSGMANNTPKSADKVSIYSHYYDTNSGFSFKFNLRT